MGFCLDLHTHSVASDDSRATVEQYADWVGVLRRRGYRIDGFVLTEHRQFDPDRRYDDLAREKGLVILTGAEVDTDTGHFLLYGVTSGLVRHVDLGDVAMDAAELVRIANETGAIAVPAHPGRFGIGLCDFVNRGADLPSVRVVERLNGSDRPGERERAEDLMRRRGYLGIGGSDAHLASSVGTCMTRFVQPVRDERALVRALRLGEFEAVLLKESKEA